MKIVGITACIGLRNIFKCLGLELGFRGPANIGIGIGIGKEVIYTRYLGLDLGLEFLMPIIQRLGYSLMRLIDQINSCTLKKCQTESFIPIVCSHLQVKTREKIILLSLKNI